MSVENRADRPRSERALRGWPRVFTVFATAATLGLLATASSGQLSSANQQLWYPSPPSITAGGGLNEVATFGYSVAAGDFDGDGHLDLAIGSAWDSPGGPNEGSIHVLYGTSNGLSATYHTQWYQSQPGFPGDVYDDNLGSALAAGDFNGDGVDDLAIAAESEDYGSVSNAGAITIMYGAYGLGLVLYNEHVIHQETLGISDTAQAGDKFGHHLAVGDFDNDGRDDLVVSVPDEDIVGVERAGAVHIIYGSSNGLDPLSQQFVHAGTFGISLTKGAQLGWDVAVGHFNADAFADLAITFFAATSPRTAYGGGVLVLYGNPYGIGSWSSSQILPHLRFSLAAGDFVGDSRDDLAAGFTSDIKIFPGSGSGLSTVVAQTLAPLDIGPLTELVAGNFDGNGRDDLAVGMPQADLPGGLDNAGTVSIYYGLNSGGLLTSPATWHQNTNVYDIAEAGDWFGWALATGDFRGDGADDLVVGAPLDDAFGLDAVGFVHVLNGLP